LDTGAFDRRALESDTSRFPDVVRHRNHGDIFALPYAAARAQRPRHSCIRKIDVGDREEFDLEPSPEGPKARPIGYVVRTSRGATRRCFDLAP